jgi:hypothetical protein
MAGDAVAQTTSALSGTPLLDRPPHRLRLYALGLNLQIWLLVLLGLDIARRALF